MRRWAYVMVAAAAVLWGIISVFVKGLAALGLSPIQIVAVRMAFGAAGMLVYATARNRKLLSIRPADAGYFVGTGIVSIVFFNWCYFSAIEETSVAMAAILLYTAPVFVVVMSRFFFGEALGLRKLAALAATFCGCAFVVGLLPGTVGGVSLYGLATGLGAGLGYALYSIFGKLALRRYGAVTVTTYTFLFAAAASLPLSGLWERPELLREWGLWGYGLGLGFFSTVLAYLLYTFGLSYVEPGRAAITATLEPLVAAAVGVAVFGESLGGWQIFGMVLVMAAVAAVQDWPNGNQRVEQAER